MDTRRYTKRPVDIEAVQTTDDNLDDVAAWCGGSIVEDVLPRASVDDPEVTRRTLNIPTLEGTMQAEVGDYVIKGLVGEFYPCKPAVFVASYVEAPQ